MILHLNIKKNNKKEKKRDEKKYIGECLKYVLRKSY